MFLVDAKCCFIPLINLGEGSWLNGHFDIGAKIWGHKEDHCKDTWTIFLKTIFEKKNTCFAKP
jgi:hypothetical protein